jgi:hypothetical protein
MIFFTFDDSNVSDLWAATILQKFGLQGIFFLNDTPDIEYQVEGLLHLGQIIGNHTAHHTILKGISEQQIADAVLPFNEKLKRLGATGDYFSYPTSSAEYGIPIIHRTFKYIYRGYDRPMPDMEGEISRVSVADWMTHRLQPIEVMASQPVPLQLHGIETGKWYDLSRIEFIELCKRKTQ